MVYVFFNCCESNRPLCKKIASIRLLKEHCHIVNYIVLFFCQDLILI